MASFNPNTTWIGLLGGGVSGSLVAGGSVFQIDLWHMGGDPVPVRVLVTGRRVGLTAEVGTGLCALVVTGCRESRDMDGIGSAGLDWELAVGLKGSAIARSGARLLKTMAAEATAEVANWAMHESAKRFVQWTVDDLGIVQSGRQFNLIPWPGSVGVGAGIFYEWQTLNLLGGNLGWKYISPYWSVENFQGSAYLQMGDIPEQDGTEIRIGLRLPEFGIDPLVVFGGHRRRGDYFFRGYVYQAGLFPSRRRGYAGINLSELVPVGLSRAGLFSVTHTDEVVRSGVVRARPVVFGLADMESWAARDTVELVTDGSGRFVKARGNSQPRK